MLILGACHTFCQIFLLRRSPNPRKTGEFLGCQEGENSARYWRNIDIKKSKRTSFPYQPFGLGDSWSETDFVTFQALFSRPAEFGPYGYGSLTIASNNQEDIQLPDPTSQHNYQV